MWIPYKCCRFHKSLPIPYKSKKKIAMKHKSQKIIIAKQKKEIEKLSKQNSEQKSEIDNLKKEKNLVKNPIWRKNTLLQEMIELNSINTTTFQEWFGLMNALSSLIIRVPMFGFKKAKKNISLPFFILPLWEGVRRTREDFLTQPLLLVLKNYLWPFYEA